MGNFLKEMRDDDGATSQSGNNLKKKEVLSLMLSCESLNHYKKFPFVLLNYS